MTAPQINIITPLYNEEETYSHLIERLNALMQNSDLSIEIILVDDRSTDNTAELITNTCKEDPRYHGILLSRNYGHQIALSAGLQHLNATEAIFVIDGDLQDPPELLDTFYAKFKEGNDVVYGVRKMRDDEGIFKKFTSHLFYRIMKVISNSDIPFDSGDFSLISVRVAKHLNKMPERARFIRGLRASLGFKQVGVPFERQKRDFGETKYTLKKMVKLALDAIFNFSEIPYKLLLQIGGTFIGVSFIYLIYALIVKFSGGAVNPGFATIITILIFSFGFIIFSLGVLGGYIIRMYNEVLNRPLFVVDKVIKQKEEKKV